MSDESTIFCEQGFICDDNGDSTNCTVLREKAVEAGYGDIFAGVYCPGEPNLLNCPVGYYCPDPETKLKCPAGYFCPHKSNSYYIKCARCQEGATKLERTWGGFAFLVTLIFLVTFYFMIDRLRKRARNQQDNAADSKRDSPRAMNQDQVQEEEKELRKKQIERIKPKLHILSSRVNQRAPTSHLSEVTADGIGVSDFLMPDALFDKLDVGRSGSLSYSEIDSLLHLDEVQLRAFVAAMNEAGGLPDSTPRVSKEVFCNHFLDVLEKATCVSPTADDARRLFREIVGEFGTNVYGELSYHTMYDSSLSNFLSDYQIYEIIKYFKSRVSPLPTLSRFESTFSLFSTAEHEHGIPLDDFAELYPRALKRVLIDHASTVDDNSGGKGQSKRLGLDILFQDLSLTVKKGDAEVKVVDSCWGRCRSNTMTAIMGGSGAGKTSLLNALCGRASYGKVTGETLINENLASIEDYQSVIGFVPQDDIIYSDLTVRENFIFSGQLRLPRGTPMEEIRELADETIAALGLVRVADSVVGDHRKRGVSGGERKRVNIGLELMAKPLACFLDEPTSGLDSYSALLVMSSLRHLVDCQGVTMVAVIHQPRKGIFDLFDSLALLGVGGRMMYFGDASGAEDYFRSQDFVLDSGEALADWLIDISSGSIRPLRFKALNQPAGAMAPPLLARSTTSVAYEQAAAARNIGPSTGVSSHANAKTAKLRRANLVAAWRDYYFTSLLEDTTHLDAEASTNIQLPNTLQRQSSFVQFRVQMKRIFLLWRRNAGAKIIDTTVIVLVGTVLALFNGITESTTDNIPNIPYDAISSDDPTMLEQYFPALFAYATLATETIISHGLMLTVVLSILEGVSSVKALIQNRDSFFRESSCGVATTPYFLAVNVSMVIESVFHMALAAVGVHWARQSIGSVGNYIAHFVVIGWLVSAWAVLLPILVSPDNVTIIVVCFLAFFAVVFSGASATLNYADFYGQFVEIIGGMFAVNRYAVEGIVVGEQRCLMPQSGFPVAEEATAFPEDKNSFNLLSLAQNDFDTVTEQSCEGWYWGVYRGLLVGATVRVIAGGLMHVMNRGKQGKKPLSVTVKENSFALAVLLGYVGICLVLVAVSIVALLN